MDLAEHRGFTELNHNASNQMLVFGERGKPENPRGKTSQNLVENQQTHHFQPAGRESSKIFQQLQVQMPGGAECFGKI